MMKFPSVFYLYIIYIFRNIMVEFYRKSYLLTCRRPFTSDTCDISVLQVFQWIVFL